MLKAYKVNDILVFATRGTEAKLLAAPQIHPAEFWQNNVADWVALRAERTPEYDSKVDPSQTQPYLYDAS